MCQCQHPFNGRSYKDNELWYWFGLPSKTNGFIKKVLMILVNDQGYQDQIHISRKVNAESATVLRSTERQETGLHAEQRRAVRKQTYTLTHCLCNYIYMQTHTC